jgi:hypothetical protein
MPRNFIVGTREPLEKNGGKSLSFCFNIFSYLVFELKNILLFDVGFLLFSQRVYFLKRGSNYFCFFLNALVRF